MNNFQMTEVQEQELEMIEGGLDPLTWCMIAAGVGFLIGLGASYIDNHMPVQPGNPSGKLTPRK